MKLILHTIILLIFVFLLLILYQKIIQPRYYEEQLNKKNIYHTIKKNIKKGTSREDVYIILNKQKIKYHDDKNKNIDITGKGITIEIDSFNKVCRFIPY